MKSLEFRKRVRLQPEADSFQYAPHVFMHTRLPDGTGILAAAGVSGHEGHIKAAMKHVSYDATVRTILWLGEHFNMRNPFFASVMKDVFKQSDIKEGYNYNQGLPIALRADHKDYDTRIKKIREQIDSVKT